METPKARFGKFAIPNEMVRNNWQRLLPAFAVVVITQVVYDFKRDTLTYWAFSEQFDEISEGDATPTYDFIFTNKDGKITVQAKRLP